jgi:hypothetical protein
VLQGSLGGLEPENRVPAQMPQVRYFQIKQYEKPSVKYIQLITPLYGTTPNPENRRDGEISCRIAPIRPDHAYSIAVKTPNTDLSISHDGVPLNLKNEHWRSNSISVLII